MRVDSILADLRNKYVFFIGNLLLLTSKGQKRPIYLMSSSDWLRTTFYQSL